MRSFIYSKSENPKDEWNTGDWAAYVLNEGMDRIQKGVDMSRLINMEDKDRKYKGIVLNTDKFDEVSSISQLSVNESQFDPIIREA